MYVLDRKPKGSRFSEIYTSRMATPSVQEQIKTQGEVVRQLKKDKAPNEKVNIWVQFRSTRFTRPRT